MTNRIEKKPLKHDEILDNKILRDEIGDKKAIKIDPKQNK
jgi:hypothetical protein